MKTSTRLLALSALASGAFLTTSAFACSTAEWSLASADATAGDPIAQGTARISGKCGLEVTADGTVVDNTPDGETTFIARFYFFGNGLSGNSSEIFNATSADSGGGDAQFNISYDGTNIMVDASAGGGDTATAVAISNKWNLIEVSWTSGGNGSLWVNADATADPASDTFASGIGSIGSAELGAVSSVATEIAFFDDYVSHRSLPVGPVLLGDSNNDGTVNGLDISGILQESNAFTPVLQVGTPDCNIDASVNGLDISGILKAADAFNPTPCGS